LQIDREQQKASPSRGRLEGATPCMAIVPLLQEGFLLWQASLRAERGEVTSGLILLIISLFMEVGNLN